MHGNTLKKAPFGAFYFLCYPLLLEAAAVLATFVHPNHIVCLCSWGFTYLPPTCNAKLFGYTPIL
ncbi:hypothetical protein B4944_17365 [Vibrio cholerae]|nr:hypothetical protein [Vibrio cholerae]